MIRDHISSDSSFFICFSDDIDQEDWLFRFVKLYQFCMGGRVFSEIPNKLRDNDAFASRLKILSYDYFELIKPFFGRSANHKTDGEYEAIGIGHYLDDKNLLAYLILDDLRARKFVNKHFPRLGGKMVGTLGFIRDSCCVDENITPPDAIGILNTIKENIENGGKSYPCGLGLTKYKGILIPIIDQVRKKGGHST